MRYLLLGYLLLILACTTHKKNNTLNISKLDSANLFDPNPQKGKIEVSQEVLCNCVMLDEEKIATSINCEKIELQNDIEFENLLQNKISDIRKNKFYIVKTNKTTSKRIIELIKIIKARQISDYKVVDLQSLFTLYEPK